MKNTCSDLVSEFLETPEYKPSKLPMVITSAEGIIIEANKAFSVFTGMTDDFETKKYNLFELTGIKPTIAKQPGSGVWLEKATEINHTAKRFLYSCSPIENTTGDKLRQYTFIDTNTMSAQSSTNATHPKVKKTEVLLTQESLPHQLYKQAGIAHWEIILEEELRLKTCNFFELLSTTKPERPITIEDVLHKNSIHPDDLPAYIELLGEVDAQKRTSYVCNYRIINNENTSVRHIQNHAYLSYDDTGNLYSWSGILKDITQLLKSPSPPLPAFRTSQLIHSQLNLELLLKTIHHAVTEHIPAPEIHLALSTEEGTQTIYFLNQQDITSEQRQGERGLIEYVLKTGEPLFSSATEIKQIIKEQIITHNGPIPQTWIGIPLKTRESTIGVLCIQSSKKELVYEEDKKTILLFITEQIALAIQKIKSEESLIKAKNSAEKSSRLKSSLLANVSHELRTPMTGILGFSEILNEELDDPRLKSMAGTIFKSAGRLMSTLNSIIDLSALEADKNSLNLKSVNTRLMMQPLLKVAYSIASDKGLYLRTSIPPDLFVKTDEKLLSQLLHHLIDNAIKFTVDGGISISVFKLNKKSTNATIRVNDTGIGIAPEHHKMIFEEFRQVSEGFSRTFEGSGLGLSLCAKISRLLNAKIWVDSIEGQGSDFYIELPIALPETDVKSASDHSPAIKTHRLSRGSVPDVLIVEDNEINRRLAALYLREICNTEMAENGYVAIEKVKRKKYDAILMDINLGAGPDGLSIAQQTRNSEFNKDTPIIAVTGYTMHGDKEKLLSNGCSHYLPKPYDKQTLLKLFSGILYN